jgi:hypothetical protein
MNEVNEMAAKFPTQSTFAVCAQTAPCQLTKRHLHMEKGTPCVTVKTIVAVPSQRPKQPKFSSAIIVFTNNKKRKTKCEREKTIWCLSVITVTEIDRPCPYEAGTMWVLPLSWAGIIEVIAVVLHSVLVHWKGKNNPPPPPNPRSDSCTDKRERDRESKGGRRGERPHCPGMYGDHHLKYQNALCAHAGFVCQGRWRERSTVYGVHPFKSKSAPVV